VICHPDFEKRNRTRENIEAEFWSVRKAVNMKEEMEKMMNKRWEGTKNGKCGRFLNGLSHMKTKTKIRQNIVNTVFMSPSFIFCFSSSFFFYDFFYLRFGEVHDMIFEMI